MKSCEVFVQKMNHINDRNSKQYFIMYLSWYRLKVAPNTSKMAQNNVREIQKKSARIARC